MISVFISVMLDDVTSFSQNLRNACKRLYYSQLLAGFLHVMDCCCCCVVVLRPR